MSLHAVIIGCFGMALPSDPSPRQISNEDVHALKVIGVTVADLGGAWRAQDQHGVGERLDSWVALPSKESVTVAIPSLGAGLRFASLDQILSGAIEGAWELPRQVLLNPRLPVLTLSQSDPDQLTARGSVRIGFGSGTGEQVGALSLDSIDMSCWLSNDAQLPLDLAIDGGVDVSFEWNMHSPLDPSVAKVLLSDHGEIVGTIRVEADQLSKPLEFVPSVLVDDFGGEVDREWRLTLVSRRGVARNVILLKSPPCCRVDLEETNEGWQVVVRSVASEFLRHVCGSGVVQCSLEGEDMEFYAMFTVRHLNTDAQPILGISSLPGERFAVLEGKGKVQRLYFPERLPGISDEYLATGGRIRGSFTSPQSPLLYQERTSAGIQEKFLPMRITRQPARFLGSWYEFTGE